MNLANIILRTVSFLGFTTKGSSLTWTEEDNNFIQLANAIKILERQNPFNFSTYNPSTPYSVTTPATYVSYNGSTWKAISSSTGITPGTDATKWELVSNGEFAHQKNQDTKLAEGTITEVTSAQLRLLVDNSAKHSAGASFPPNGVVNNLAQGYKFPSLYFTLSNSLFICTTSTNSSATWVLIFGSGD